MKQKAVIHSRVRHHRLKWVLALILVAAAISWWVLFMGDEVESEDAYVAGNIVPIRALVPGIVSKVSVDDSMQVRSGQKLIEEEKNLASAKLEKAAAVLADAVRNTRSRFAQVDGETEEVAALEAERKRLAEDLDRYLKASESGAVSSQQVSDTRAGINVLDRKIAARKALLAKARALVSGTTVENNPQVMKARAEYVESYIACRRSSIFSPVNGYVANRKVEAGEMVQAGQYLMSVVPLDELWITANLKENRLSRVGIGEAVSIRAQAYGEVVFHGRVIGMNPSGGSTFSLFPPNNATGNYIHIVERVPVRISLDREELKSHPLRPGMSVKVSIDTRQGRGSLASQVDAKGASFATTLYADELRDAQKSAMEIIHRN